MKAITLWQPWASLIALGLKRYETRCWATNYRGKLLIHAAKRPIDREGLTIWGDAHILGNRGIPDPCTKLPLGAIVAIADLVDCLEVIGDLSKPPIIAVNKHLQSNVELLCGDWQVGRFAWKLENIRQLAPIPAKGYQRFWIPDDEVIGNVNQQLK
ncbi:ASCH domain-containing protein [Kamptonema sp. UHCC 0994]|uniref:ASCH domain-containing protein n=1 Tax=Kamptonema sp. UHCC 0994 TaxID=3031329 RepID=UPI0023B999C8|nr:ASCH domain-containing protein [Kamptonema sp. UHCC 0994]MDF0553112.1 ASCH domain-containing protein [Kamptonema sp. UHCC 0994]